MTKESAYKQLVYTRKECKVCQEFGLTNQSLTSYDTNSIGKWSDWQGNLDAKIVVIGQDWGSLKYWNDNHGTDSETNPTNLNLIKLFEVLGYQIGTIFNPNPNQPLFFSNAVLCLKSGTMSSNISKRCFRNCGSRFLKPLIDIINPEILITLGTAPFASILELYRPEGWNKIPPLRDVVRKNPIILNSEGLKLFPMYHCGGLGLANRNLTEQKKDWEFMKAWVQ
jgi:DNA polymerase